MASLDGEERREMRTLDRAENYADSMLTSLAELQEQKSFTDFTLKIGDTTLTAHRCVLTVASEYFRALFNSGMTEAEAGEVILDHLDFDGVKTAIDYMYGRSIEFDLHDLIPLIAVADYFKLEQLKDRLCKLIVEELSPANCIYWYQVADQYAMEYLKKIAKEVIRIEFSDVAFSEEFMNLPVSLVDDCIQHEIPVPADTVLKACLTWIEADVESRKSDFARFADHIDFSSCSQEHLMFEQHQCQDLGMARECSEHFSEYITQDVLPVDHVPEKQSILLSSGHDILHKLNPYIYEINLCTGVDYQVAKLPDECVRGMAAMCSTPQGIFSAGGRENLISVYKQGSTVCWLYNKYLREVMFLHPLPVPIYGAGAVHLDNKIYVVGGHDGKMNAIDILDLCGNTWVSGPTLLEEVWYPKVACIGHSIYVLNDCDISDSPGSIQCFDTRTDTWTCLTSLPNGLIRSSEAPLFSARDNLYCFANECVQYNAVTRSWMDMAQPTAGLESFQSASPVRMGNKVVICGRSRPAWTHTYHLDSDSWSEQKSPHIMTKLQMPFCMAL